MSRGVGRTLWVLPGGFVPMPSHGPEPDMTSREQFALLNTSDQDAHVTIQVLFADREPIGLFEVRVGARRMRVVRTNDLIDPVAVPLETPYAAIVRSDVPVVVQVTRQDTGAAARAWAGTMAYASATVETRHRPE
jgi:hypothetical protein